MVQRGVLKALASAPTPNPYAKGLLDRHGLSVGGTQRAIRMLLSRDLIERDEEGGYSLKDPVMAASLTEG